MASDPSGRTGNYHEYMQEYWENKFKWIVKQVVKKLVNKAIRKGADTLGLPSTYSIGIVGQGACIFGGSISGCLSIDLDGNVVFQGSSGLGGGSPSASVSLYLSATNANNVYELEGWSSQTGGSADVGLGVGGEAVFFGDEKIYSGYNVFAGIGFSPFAGEGHTEIVYTAPSIDLFNSHDLLFEIAWWLSGN